MRASGERNSCEDHQLNARRLLTFQAAACIVIDHQELIHGLIIPRSAGSQVSPTVKFGKRHTDGRVASLLAMTNRGHCEARSNPWTAALRSQ